MPIKQLLSCEYAVMTPHYCFLKWFLLIKSCISRIIFPNMDKIHRNIVNTIVLQFSVPIEGKK